MYGRNKSPILMNAFGKELNVGKMLDIVRGFVTKANLSGIYGLLVQDSLLMQHILL
mgnify:CR=1 FL=1